MATITNATWTLETLDEFWEWVNSIDKIEEMLQETVEGFYVRSISNLNRLSVGSSYVTYIRSDDQYKMNTQLGYSGVYTKSNQTLKKLIFFFSMPVNGEKSKSLPDTKTTPIDQEHLPSELAGLVSISSEFCQKNLIDFVDTVAGQEVSAFIDQYLTAYKKTQQNTPFAMPSNCPKIVLKQATSFYIEESGRGMYELTPKGIELANKYF